MAVRLDPGKPDIVMGRAVLNIKAKLWVRSYKREEGGNDACSGTDERLENWLREQGYTKKSEWPIGTRFARVEHPDGGRMMPYIDGNNQKVEFMHDAVEIAHDGSACNNTDGTVDEPEVYGECDCCGADVLENDDDRIWVGVNEDRLICGCCTDDYRYVSGQNNRGYTSNYYVSDEIAVRVNGEWYDSENLPDSICMLADGEYAERDACVWCATDDEWYEQTDEDIVKIDDKWYRTDDEDIVKIDDKWYRTDDDNVVQCKDDVYRLKDDCWEDAHSNDWYPDSEPSIDLNGETYHPDTLRELLAKTNSGE
jgi:hypothetical protein